MANSNNKRYMSVHDDEIFDRHLKENNLFNETDPVQMAIAIAKYKAQAGNYDTWVGKRDGLVCLDCVKTIMTDAGIPMPNTSDIDTFISAVSGWDVELPEHGIDEFRSDNQFIKYNAREYKDSNSWQVIDDVGAVQPGDILVVETIAGLGKHATMVTNVSGTAEDADKFLGWIFSGISVVHDRGQPTTTEERVVQLSKYEWEDLVSGQGGDYGENRRFIGAYRYIGE